MSQCVFFWILLPIEVTELYNTRTHSFLQVKEWCNAIERSCCIKYGNHDISVLLSYNAVHLHMKIYWKNIHLELLSHVKTYPSPSNMVWHVTGKMILPSSFVIRWRASLIRIFSKSLYVLRLLLVFPSMLRKSTNSLPIGQVKKYTLFLPIKRSFHLTSACSFRLAEQVTIRYAIKNFIPVRNLGASHISMVL